MFSNLVEAPAHQLAEQLKTGEISSRRVRPARAVVLVASSAARHPARALTSRERAPFPPPEP